MLFTLFASELLLIIPDLIDRFTSHVTMVTDTPDVSTPDRQCSCHRDDLLLRRDELFRLVW